MRDLVVTLTLSTVNTTVAPELTLSAFEYSPPTDDGQGKIQDSSNPLWIVYYHGSLLTIDDRSL